MNCTLEPYLTKALKVINLSSWDKWAYIISDSDLPFKLIVFTLIIIYFNKSSIADLFYPIYDNKLPNFIIPFTLTLCTRVVNTSNGLLILYSYI